MNLPYQCPDCGTELGYEGLCWRCRTAALRRAAAAWTPAEIAAKEQEIIAQIDDVPNDFWYLLCREDSVAPAISRAALAARTFWPPALYYHAPADVRDGLIAALMETEAAQEANELMMCLGMQGDDRALAALLALEREPRPWRGQLYVNPSVYAQCGGWTFDYAEPMLSRYTLDGGSTVLPYENADPTAYMEELDTIFDNDLILGASPVPRFYGAFFDDVSTLGGFALWEQDWSYTTCPDCGQPMKYLMQIRWNELADYMEGTLYIEFCPACQVVSMQHQQT